MLLYRIQSKKDEFGPFSSSVKYEGCPKNHIQPDYMKSLDSVKIDAFCSRKFVYFFSDLAHLCYIMGIAHIDVPGSSGWCGWMSEWEIITRDTVDMVEGVDYHILEEYQVIVHMDLVLHEKDCYGQIQR